jgi:2'-5' RNA ligase
MQTSSPLILTLKLDSIAFDVLDRLRQQHFPPERNFLSAHITLFHKLPSEQELAIRQTLEDACSTTPAVHLLFPTLRSLGRGVAIQVDCPELVQLRNHLAQEWNPWLSPQDKQRYQPHITIQNKVAPSEAQQLYDRLADGWNTFSGKGEGLLLWRYQGGPWELAHEFTFKLPKAPSLL